MPSPFPKYYLRVRVLRVYGIPSFSSRNTCGRRFGKPLNMPDSNYMGFYDVIPLPPQAYIVPRSAAGPAGEPARSG